MHEVKLQRHHDILKLLIMYGLLNTAGRQLNEIYDNVVATLHFYQVPQLRQQSPSVAQKKCPNGAENQLCWALSVSFVMLVTEAPWILQQKAAQMISNPWNPTEGRGGQLVRNPVLLIREECSAFHLDAKSIAVPPRTEEMSFFFVVVVLFCTSFKKC